MRRFDEIETPLDTVQTCLYPIQPAMDASLPFFAIRDANLNIARLINHPVNFFANTPQIDENHIVGRIRHPVSYFIAERTGLSMLRPVFLSHKPFKNASPIANPYSAAMPKSLIGSACGLAVYWSMRRSISPRKCRMRPCTGQAAASPSAQIVWPSIWVVTSNSMSISRLCARPSAIRESTRQSQPVPSRQGVHWPQLSCL